MAAHKHRISLGELTAGTRCVAFQGVSPSGHKANETVCSWWRVCGEETEASCVKAGA